MGPGTILLIVTFIVLITSFISILKLKNPRSMLYAGMTLIVFGLVVSAASFWFVDAIFDKTDGEANNFRISLLSSSYLIISAIGANMFSSAICSEVKSKHQ